MKSSGRAPGMFYCATLQGRGYFFMEFTKPGDSGFAMASVRLGDLEGVQDMVAILERLEFRLPADARIQLHVPTPSGLQ